jgi:hypothetical protein
MKVELNCSDNKVKLAHIKPCHFFEFEGEIYIRGTPEFGCMISTINIKSNKMVPFSFEILVTPLKNEDVLLSPEVKKTYKEVSFSDIEVGQFFKCNDTVFIKISPSNVMNNSFSIETNKKATSSPDKMVIPLYQECELRLSSVVPSNV